MKGQSDASERLGAVPVLENALSGFNDAYARDKSLYLWWLADAYLNAEIGGNFSSRPPLRIRVRFVGHPAMLSGLTTQKTT